MGEFEPQAEYGRSVLLDVKGGLSKSRLRRVIVLPGRCQWPYMSRFGTSSRKKCQQIGESVEDLEHKVRKERLREMGLFSLG